MANDNTTRPDPKPVRPVYFYCPEDGIDIGDIVYALHGVCTALDGEDMGGDFDYGAACLRSNLAKAAQILSKQLHDRHTFKPLREKRPKLVGVPSLSGAA